MNNIRIGVAVMVHNMEDLIPPCVQSINWVDSVYIFNDHCADRTIDMVKKYCKTELHIENSPFKETAFKHGELEARNYIVGRAFKLTGADVLILLDADEMLSDILKPAIISAFSNDVVDSMAFTIWHLFDTKNYIHIWETFINGVYMIDPHVRIIKRGLYFKSRFPDGRDPGIKITEKTLCLHGAYHFHLKYFHKLKLPNYSFHFLPKYPTKKDLLPFLRKLEFTLPSDIAGAIMLLKGRKNFGKEIVHHKEIRTKISSTEEALIHPRDKNKQ